MIQIWNKRNKIIPAILLFALLMAPTTRATSAQSTPTNSHSNTKATTAHSPSVPNTLLVQLRQPTTRAEAHAVTTALGYDLIDWLEPLQIAKVQRTNSSSTIRAASAIYDMSAIESIETNSAVYGTNNDPALQNSFQSYGLQNTYTKEGWAIEGGSKTTVIAILDTGLDMDNPEFSGRIAQGYDFINDDLDPDDDNGHGTHVSGIAAASYANEIGTAGVCHGCSIMPVKVLDENNAGDWFAVAQGIVYATNTGADIINLSLGSAQSSSTVRAAIQYAQEHGTLIVAAAGNLQSNKPFYPAAYDGVIAVGATKLNNELWNLSNYGSYITVVAPGDNIYSTAVNGGSRQAELGTQSGTSMAAPYVTGLAGLLMSQNPDRTAQELMDIIVETAIDLGDSGADNQFGNGLINVLAALKYAGTSTAIQGVSEPFETQLRLPVAVKN